MDGGPLGRAALVARDFVDDRGGFLGRDEDHVPLGVVTPGAKEGYEPLPHQVTLFLVAVRRGLTLGNHSPALARVAAGREDMSLPLTPTALPLLSPRRWGLVAQGRE